MTYRYISRYFPSLLLVVFFASGGRHFERMPHGRGSLCDLGIHGRGRDSDGMQAERSRCVVYFCDRFVIDLFIFVINFWTCELNGI